MRGLTRADMATGSAFVLAALAEAVVLHRDEPGLLLFGCAGAPVLMVLAVRRQHPALVVSTLSGFAVMGIAAQSVFRPDAQDSAGVWMFALMLACYSLGAHATGRSLALGGLAPMLVVSVANVPTMAGWEMASGIAFVTLFAGVLPTAVGALVRRRRSVLGALSEQRARILDGRRAESRTAVLTERVRTNEHLRPALLDGLRDLAQLAESGGGAATIEARARDLLGRTRREVLALTEPVVETSDPAPSRPSHDHLAVLRSAAQPWTVVAAGALGVGLALESTAEMALAVPDWAAAAASFVVAAPLALLWWRPLPVLLLAWGAATAFSRGVAPLDGALSGSALALALAFTVAVVSGRRAAVAGLLVCWFGEILGVGASDPLGVATVLLAAWSGGVLVNEVSDLVEQSRENNRELAGQAGADTARAVVEERLRLARELHDVLGHSLTVVALQAGAARRLEHVDSARAGEALRAIATAARQGLVALDEEQNVTEGLARLLDRTRAAGLAVDVEVDDLTDVDPATRHVAERVLQESLTNVLRHAPGARARVRISTTPEGVAVVVTNSRPTGSGAGPGSSRGLAGIRERVAALAGSVAWGPAADGGFEVRAHLPMDRAGEVVG